MLDPTHEFEAVCKAGKKYLIRAFRAPVPFFDLAGETRRIEVWLYRTAEGQVVKGLRNGYFKIKDCGTVLRQIKDGQ